uniref:hypothetical protein n=1 Tax=Polaribacter sp. TaxID=1920175 RepID=UPI004048B70E
MTFLEKIQSPNFFINFCKVAIPFFIVLVIFSLLISNFNDLFSFNFSAVSEANFSEGKWMNFFGIKALFSVLYGFWITIRKTR